MVDGGAQEYRPDRRGNRLERHLFTDHSDGSGHHLYLRATPEIASQFLRAAQYRRARPTSGWTHCLWAPGGPLQPIKDLAGLLGEVLTLPAPMGIDLAIALDLYKSPADGVDPRDWDNTAVGDLVFVGKYCRGGAGSVNEAGRTLTRHLLGVIQRHPTLAEADAIVAVPGHDRRVVGFGERLGVSVAKARGLPVIHMATAHELRPPAKDRPTPLHGEFSITDDLTGRTVIIVDDVLRRGSTLSAAACAALQAGASFVAGLVAVRTVRR